MYSKAIVAAGFAGLAAAAPASISKRQQQINDGVILNYALTLEHLEAVFYKQAFQNYTQADFVAAGFADPFYQNLKEVAFDESTHVDFLTSALKAAGVAPAEECTYAFPSTDVKSFVALSSVLEGVGVTAYLGAANKIANANYLTAAGSILTVESRHNAYVRAARKQAPIPQPFDTPLGFNEVFSLAAPFIKSCPSSSPALPFKAFPALGVKETTIKSGDTITLTTPGYELAAPAGGQIYAAFIAVTGPTFVDAKKVDGGYQVTVPKGFAGQSYAVLTACKDQVNDDTVAAGPAIIEIEGTIGTQSK